MSTYSIEKTLSANDSGETGGHQAGILVPKTIDILSFFPELSINQKNPRSIIRLTDNENKIWVFNFIYYNNKFYGGTRNEYRLTGMTKYINQNNLRTNDRIVLSQSSGGQYSIDYIRSKATFESKTKILKLGNNWKVINIKK
ncbi:MAG: EcoRII N-terminal effector-binding domain-containing protein [Saprospiraceae bacterium]